MAAEERTEKPTAKRKREARRKGQVAKSTDLNGGLVMAAAVFGLTAVAPAVVHGAGRAMTTVFAMVANPAASTSTTGLNALMHLVLTTMLSTVLPIAGICLGMGLLANVAQVGFKPSFAVLQPDFKRLNPVSGAKNLFGTRGLVETVKALAKVGVVGGVAASALLPQLTNLGASVGTPPAALGALISS